MVRYRTNRNSIGWIEAPEMAQRAGISRQAASKALSRAAEGKPWNGTPLKVRLVRGAGGAGGLRWQVRVSSLPEALQRE